MGSAWSNSRLHLPLVFWSRKRDPLEDCRLRGRCSSGRASVGGPNWAGSHWCVSSCCWKDPKTSNFRKESLQTGLPKASCGAGVIFRLLGLSKCPPTSRIRFHLWRNVLWWSPLSAHSGLRVRSDFGGWKEELDLAGRSLSLFSHQRVRECCSADEERPFLSPLIDRKNLNLMILRHFRYPNSRTNNTYFYEHERILALVWIRQFNFSLKGNS